MGGRRDLHERFGKEQWKFCSHVFSTATSLADLQPFVIFPCSSKERLDKDKSDNDETVVYKVKAHKACRGFIPKSYPFGAERLSMSL